MKTLNKLILAASILTISSVFAAEVPKPTFHIWGLPSDQPLDDYNLIKNLPGQEIFAYSVNCINGGTDLAVPDLFAIRTTVNNASNGTLKYEMDISTPFPNLNSESGDCYANVPIGVGLGVATSGERRIIMFGLLGGGNGVVKSWDAETGRLYFTLTFPQFDTEGFSISGNAWSAVGNFLSNRNDQLRVGYSRVNPDASLDLKITYYDVLTGGQVGNLVTINVPAPTVQ